MDLAIIAIFGIFSGVLVRTLSPALRKMKQTAQKGEKFKWNHKYTVTAIISGITAFIVTMLSFPSFQITSNNPITVFSSGFIFGTGLNSVINEVQAWFK